MSVTGEGLMNSDPAPTTRRASLQARMLAAIFVMSFALDFKGNAGGSLIQYVMAGVNTIAFLLLAARYRLTLRGSGLATFVFWGWVAFLLTGSVGALLNDVPFDHYMRTIYPYALFAEGFLVAWWVARDARGATTLVAAMLFAAVVSLLFTFWWGFHFSGENAQVIRYQILSPLIPFLVVVAGYDLFFARRRRLRSLVILVTVFSVIALAVTRGMLLVVGMVGVAVLAAWLWNGIRGAISLPRPIARAFAWGSVIGILGLLTALIVAPDVVARWVNRSLGVGHDITFWSRVAAVIGQWNQLVASPVSWLAGNGFGHSYHYAQTFAHLVVPGISPTAFAAPMWFPGEFMWMTPIYYAGIIAGGLAIGILLWGALRSFHILRLLLRQHAWRLVTTRPIWVGVLGYFAFLGLGFTANPFIIRLSALFMGLSLGLTIAAVRGMPDYTR